MKSILKKDRILVFVALLGLLASLAPLAARTKAEQSNRYYDYILDYSSLRYMASQSTRSEGECHRDALCNDRCHRCAPHAHANPGNEPQPAARP